MCKILARQMRNERIEEICFSGNHVSLVELSDLVNTCAKPLTVYQMDELIRYVYRT